MLLQIENWPCFTMTHEPPVDIVLLVSASATVCATIQLLMYDPQGTGLSLREFAGKTLENLRKKLRLKVTKNATKSAA